MLATGSLRVAPPRAFAHGGVAVLMCLNSTNRSGYVIDMHMLWICGYLIVLIQMYNVYLQDFLTCLLWTFRVEKESNLIMEHVFPALHDALWAKWERIFLEFERGEYIDKTTLGLVKDKKGYKPKSVVKNDLKHARGLTEEELDMAADQCLVIQEGDKYPRHTLKTIGDWALNRKKKNETYIAMAECLNPIPRFLVQQDQKRTIDREEWKAWKERNNFGRLQRERLLDLLGVDYLAAALNPAKKKVPVPARFKEGVNNILVTTISDVSEEHVLLTIDNDYHCSGGGENLGPITHALLDTRFLPRRQAGVDSPVHIKEVIEGTLRGIRQDMPGILEAPQLWTVVSECPDRHFVHTLLKTFLPSNVRFCEAFYHVATRKRLHHVTTSSRRVFSGSRLAFFPTKVSLPQRLLCGFAVVGRC